MHIKKRVKSDLNLRSFFIELVTKTGLKDNRKVYT
ncbi:hypothetical protein BN1080_02194 [Planococcus massiliensis]|uniref:Uncharacterized protein n=1 Tax=Planococcus massiliensis TaxID=1499687 RepID=A0A098ELQ0_9BACL|nr:hypothetical protein BN1080_02194 [Planococcus massiliensis]